MVVKYGNILLITCLFTLIPFIEMLYLVDEMHKQYDKTNTIIFGKEIPFETYLQMCNGRKSEETCL